MLDRLVSFRCEFYDMMKFYLVIERERWEKGVWKFVVRFFKWRFGCWVWEYYSCYIFLVCVGYFCVDEYWSVDKWSCVEIIWFISCF